MDLYLLFTFTLKIGLEASGQVSDPKYILLELILRRAVLPGSGGGPSWVVFLRCITRLCLPCLKDTGSQGITLPCFEDIPVFLGEL